MKLRKSLKIVSFIILIVLVLSSCNNGTPSDTKEEDHSVTTDSPTADISRDVVYTIVRPDKCETIIKDKANKLYFYLSQGGKYDIGTDWYSDRDPSFVIPEAEILVGETNRAESRQILSTLGYSDYYIGIVNKKLVIVGGSDGATVEAIDYFMSKYSPKNIEIAKIEEYKYTAESPVEKLSFAGVDYSAWNIVYKYNDREYALSAAKDFAHRIGELTGIPNEPKQVDGFPSEKGTIIFTVNNDTMPTDVTYSADGGVLTVCVGSPYISGKCGVILADAIVEGKNSGVINIPADIARNTVEVVKKNPPLSSQAEMRIAYLCHPFFVGSENNTFDSPDALKVSSERSQELLRLLPDIALLSGTENMLFDNSKLGYPVMHVYDRADVSSTLVYKKNTFNVSAPEQILLMQYTKKLPFGLTTTGSCYLYRTLLENKATKEKVLIVNTDGITDFKEIEDADKYQKCTEAILNSLSELKNEYGNIKTVISVYLGDEMPKSEITRITELLGTPISYGDDGHMLFCLGFNVTETIGVEDDSALVTEGNKPVIVDVK